MSEATDAAADAAHIVCECGGDHRPTGNRSCPVIMILHELHVSIDEFLDEQEILEFGEEGPMLPCLLGQIEVTYKTIIGNFGIYQAVSEQHPEWHLATEISRLRTYFDQVAEYYVEKREAFADETFENDGVLPKISGNEEQTLLNAKKKVHDCYGACYNAIEVHGALNLRDPDDPKGCLPATDNALKIGLDAIMLLPENENKIAQELTKQLYDVWNETRRLFKFADFEPRRVPIYRSEALRLSGRPSRKRAQQKI